MKGLWFSNVRRSGVLQLTGGASGQARKGVVVVEVAFIRHFQYKPCYAHGNGGANLAQIAGVVGIL